MAVAKNIVANTDLGQYMNYNGIEAGKLNPILPAINSAPVGFIPSATGNATNRNEIVTDPNGYKWFIDYAGDAILLDVPRIIIAQDTIVTHLDAVNNNTTTNALTQNVAFPLDGDYLLTLSFNYNVDANNAYGKVYATLGGNGLDLNNRSADPQGANQILVVEMKDNGNTSGGAITGTGSGMKMPYHMQFYLPGKTVGVESFIIDVGCQTATVEASIWNIVAKFELINQ